MDAGAIERRGNGVGRVPLDVLIELAHHGFDEPFEADGVDIGIGGLSMRATYLPEVGSRLVCRFECPPDGETIEVEGEVVWAADHGPHRGEFGLRFGRLDDRCEDAIRRLIFLGGEGPSTPIPVTSGAQTNGSAKLFLDGVPTPVVARVTHRAADLILMEQDLPFLKLGTGVSFGNAMDEGKRGRLESVDLALDGELPRLVLAISLDVMPAAADADTTLADAPAPALVAEDEPRRRDEPIVFATAKEDGELAVAIAAASEHPAAGAPDPLEKELGVSRGFAMGAKMFAPLRRAMRHPTVARVTPHWDRARDKIGDAWDWVKPHAALLAVRIAYGLRVTARHIAPLFAKVAPVLKSAATRASTFVRERFGARFPALAGRARRRTTAPPPQQTNVAARPRKRASEEIDASPSPRKNRRRALLLGAVALSGVALTVYALAPGGDQDIEAAAIAGLPPIAPAPAVAPPAPAPPVASPEPAPPAGPPVAAATGPEPGATPVAGDLAAAEPPPAPPVQVRMPLALERPSLAGGPIAEPTFPSLRGGARPSAPPESVPQGSPYAVDVRSATVAGQAPAAAPAVLPAAVTSGHHTFGAGSVRGGRSFMLRMSRPVESIRGIPDDGGFTVHVMGALSIDRASPIAAARTGHPAVERAMVLNRGDHAELIIRFRAGREPPAYRVVARGSAIEIVIGR